MVTASFDAKFSEDLRRLLRWRRDVRHFKRDPLPDGTLERLIRDATRSPSVGFSQPWRFVIVEDPARRTLVAELFERCNRDALSAYSGAEAAHYARLKLAGLAEAPSHVAVFSNSTTARGRGLGRATMPETADYSTVTAIYSLWLLARAEGIGLGWVSILEPAAMPAILEVPATWKFIAYLCVGYAQSDSDVPELERQAWEQRLPDEAVLIRR
jgi:5,6-dimethylbenzimidazole synthase